MLDLVSVGWPFLQLFALKPPDTDFRFCWILLGPACTSEGCPQPSDKGIWHQPPEDREETSQSMEWGWPGKFPISRASTCINVGLWDCQMRSLLNLHKTPEVLPFSKKTHLLLWVPSSSEDSALPAFQTIVLLLEATCTSEALTCLLAAKDSLLLNPDSPSDSKG